MKLAILLTVVFALALNGLVYADSPSLNKDDLIASEVLTYAFYKTVQTIGADRNLTGTTVFDLSLTSMTTSDFNFTLTSGNLPGNTWNVTGDKEDGENIWDITPIGPWVGPEIDPHLWDVDITESEYSGIIYLECANIVDEQDGWTVTWSPNGTVASSSHTCGATDTIRIREDEEGLFYDIEVNSDNVIGYVNIEMNGMPYVGEGEITYTAVPEPSSMLGLSSMLIPAVMFSKKRKAG